jgi:DNA polymerase-1
MGTGDLLASDLRNGIDAHRDMAASIAGLTYEAFTREHELYRDYRQMSKAANFGFPGGLGPEAFVSYAWGTWGVRVTIPEAKRLRNQWRRKRPDVVRYMATVDKWLGGSCLACNVPVAGCAVCPSCGADVACGILRHYGSGRIRGGCTYTQGCNTLFQGLGGDVTKHALWALTKAGFAVAVFVHDEYVIEVDKASAVEAAYEIKTILERVASAWLPAAPARVEPVLATRWVKDDPLYDSAGRLALIEVSV